MGKRKKVDPVVWAFWGSVILPGLLTLGQILDSTPPDNGLLNNQLEAAKIGAALGNLLGAVRS
jgi:hypothetical protein